MKFLRNNPLVPAYSIPLRSNFTNKIEKLLCMTFYVLFLHFTISGVCSDFKIYLL